MIDAKLNIILHKNQRIINDSKARFNVIKAGRRFGKTWLALYRMCVKAGRPNSVIWYVAPTYKQAKTIAWKDLEFILYPSRHLVKRSIENDLYKEFFNGTRIYLIGADNETSLRGPKLHHVVFDEAAYIKEDAWASVIRPQLLSVGEEEDGTADFISSPNDKGRNWYTNFHAEAKRKQDAGDKEWAAHFYTIYDNPSYNEDRIKNERENTTEDRWNLEFMCQESEYAGQLYGEFDSEKNMGEYQGRDPLPAFRGIDWGIAHPTVCLWVKLDILTKTVYFYDEFVKSGMVIAESCGMIKQITGQTPIDWTVIDPSTAKRNSQTGRSDSVEFARNGVTCIPADNRDRGYDVAKMFLKKGMVKISPKCKSLIYGLKNVQRGDAEGDDCTDVFRYIILRIHDYINGMNVFDHEQVISRPQVMGDEINLNDDRFFPKRQEPREAEWVFSEVA